MADLPFNSSQALRAGIRPKVLSERLGHAMVSIMLGTHSHAIPAMQEEAALIARLVFASHAAAKANAERKGLR